MDAVAQIETAQAEQIVTAIVAETAVVEARAEAEVAQAECATAQAVAETAIAEATAEHATEIVAASLPQKDDSPAWRENFDSLKAELLTAVQPLATLTAELQSLRQTQAEQAGILTSLLVLLPPKQPTQAAEPVPEVPANEATPESGKPNPQPESKGGGQRKKIRRI